jgi:hypothetical protein
MKKIEANDPFEARLKPLSQDVSQVGPAWTLSVQGDQSSYLGPDLKKTVNNGIIVIKCHFWKGHVTVY